MIGPGRIALLLLIGFINSEPLEKSYQKSLLSFSEFDLNHDCIVPYDEYKSWVLDMLFFVIKFQALVEADHPGLIEYQEDKYESQMRRVIDNLGRLSHQGTNATKVMMRFFDRLVDKLSNQTDYSDEKIRRVFKFNSRINLSFWYNL